MNNRLLWFLTITLLIGNIANTFTAWNHREAARASLDMVRTWINVQKAEIELACKTEEPRHGE